MKIRNLMCAAMLALTVGPFAVAAEPKEEKQVLIHALIFKVRGEAYREMKFYETFGKTDTQLIDSDQLETMMKKAKSLGMDVLSSPRIMLINGQQGVCNIGGERAFVTGLEVGSDSNGGPVLRQKQEMIKTGLEFKCTPKVSDDGRSTQVQIQFTEQSVDEPVRMKPVTSVVNPAFGGGSDGMPAPVTQLIQKPVVNTRHCQATVRIQDGKSVLVKVGSRECVNSIEMKTPVLGDVPYVGRLFRNIGVEKDTEYTFLMLKLKVDPKPTDMAVTPPVRPTADATPVPMPQPVPMAVRPVPMPLPMPVQSYPMPAPMMTQPFGIPADVVRVTNAVAVTREAPVATAGKHAAILKILIEQYQAACKTGDTAKARTIAAHCLELDPTCFAK